MKKVFALSLLAAVPFAAFAQGQLEPLPTESASITGADIGGGSGDFRGVAFNEATGNVILADDDGNRIHVLDEDLNLIRSIVNVVGLANGAIDPYQVKVTSDGQIYSQDFEGNVTRIGDDATTDASGAPEVLTTLGTTRGFDVVGDFSAGTVTIAVSVGTDVLVYTQDAASSDAFTLAQTVDVSAATTGEVESLFFSDDLNTLYVWNNGGNIFAYTGGVGSYGSPSDLGVGGFRAGADYDDADDYAIAVLDSGSGAALFAQTFSDLKSTPVANGFATYTQVGNNNSGAAALNKADDVAYIVGGNVCYRLGTPSTDVSDWSILD